MHAFTMYYTVCIVKLPKSFTYTLTENNTMSTLNPPPPPFPFLGLLNELSKVYAIYTKYIYDIT